MGGSASFPPLPFGDAIQATRSRRSKSFHDVALLDNGVSIFANSFGPVSAVHVEGGTLAPPSVPEVGDVGTKCD